MYPTTPDERAIYGEYVRYFRLVDAGRFDDAAAMFRDAVVRTPEGTWHGEAGARAAFDQVRLYDGSPRTKHLMGTCDITVASGRTEARALTYVLVLQATSALPLQLIRASRLADTFRRDGSGWRLIERDETVGRRDGDLTGHLRS